mgnify:CR=1 FL=1
MICRHCHKENPKSVKYCIHCGKPLESERQTPPVFDPNKEDSLNDDWSKISVETEMEKEKIQPSKKNSHTPVLIVLGILVGVLIVGGGIGYFMYSNYQQEVAQHQQEVARLEKEKEQEKEARKKAEEQADDLQDENDYLEDRNDALEDRQKDQDEEDHYQYGFLTDCWYKANYNMALRSAGDYNASQTGHLRKDERIFIEEIIAGSNGSYWGRSSSGDWVCIQDNDYDYLDED